MKRMDLVERLDKHTRQSETADGCNVWIGPIKNNGYGHLNVGGHMRMAHRLRWEANNGPIPDGLCVLHRCDNKPCNNISHLFLGTPLDNTKDAIRKGRIKSRLNEHVVRQIRRLHSGGCQQKLISKMLDVPEQTINHVVLGHYWSWVK